MDLISVIIACVTLFNVGKCLRDEDDDNEDADHEDAEAENVGDENNEEAEDPMRLGREKRDELANFTRNPCKYLKVPSAKSPSSRDVVMFYTPPEVTVEDFVVLCLLGVPGDFVSRGEDKRNHAQVLKRLRETVGSLVPIPTTWHGTTPASVPPALASSKYVFLRRDDHRTPLQNPYEGPYQIIEHGDKFCKIDMGGRTEKISVDRLKPAKVTDDVVVALPPRRGRPPKYHCKVTLLQVACVDAAVPIAMSEHPERYRLTEISDFYRAKEEELGVFHKIFYRNPGIASEKPIPFKEFLASEDGQKILHFFHPYSLKRILNYPLAHRERERDALMKIHFDMVEPVRKERMENMIQKFESLSCSSQDEDEAIDLTTEEGIDQYERLYAEQEDSVVAQRKQRTSTADPEEIPSYEVFLRVCSSLYEQVLVSNRPPSPPPLAVTRLSTLPRQPAPPVLRSVHPHTANMPVGASFVSGDSLSDSLLSVDAATVQASLKAARVPPVFIKYILQQLNKTHSICDSDEKLLQSSQALQAMQAKASAESEVNRIRKQTVQHMEPSATNVAKGTTSQASAGRNQAAESLKLNKSLTPKRTKPTQST
ncbi:unnamed protein product [Cyprideis torosa]|uniref:Uncharacterized protein n=1 Tax=Cyprideis torosa TaxID=163714 RepID=A0A7R8WFI3_9CRUS|nr:unnamed protein product [Cyprideis torosa]CAG0896896.1 unnamed protein product [Cyprideis torosa]